MTDYIKQANDFCEKYGVKIEWECTGKMINPNWGDKARRNRWEFLVTTKNGEYSGVFWDSIANSENGYPQPSSYDLLACLIKYDPGTFEEFCNEFGYDTDSKKAEKTYKAVVNEYAELCRVFGNNAKLWEEFQEIA